MLSKTFPSRYAGARYLGGRKTKNIIFHFGTHWSAWGQKCEDSLRANVFGFALKNGHGWLRLQPHKGRGEDAAGDCAALRPGYKGLVD
jgi:hypothetical protein